MKKYLYIITIIKFLQECKVNEGDIKIDQNKDQDKLNKLPPGTCHSALNNNEISKDKIDDQIKNKLNLKNDIKFLDLFKEFNKLELTCLSNEVEVENDNCFEKFTNQQMNSKTNKRIFPKIEFNYGYNPININGIINTLTDNKLFFIKNDIKDCDNNIKEELVYNVCTRFHLLKNLESINNYCIQNDELKYIENQNQKEKGWKCGDSEIKNENEKTNSPNIPDSNNNPATNDPPQSTPTQSNNKSTASFPVTKKNTSEYCMLVRNCFCHVTKGYKNRVITEQFRYNKLKRCIKQKCHETKGCRNNMPEIHPKFYYWFNNTTEALKKERKLRIQDLKNLQVPEGQEFCYASGDFDSCDSS